MKIEESWKQANGKYQCPFCKKQYCKNGIGTHVWRNHGDGINFDPFKSLIGKPGWNKGLTKETNSSVKQGGETLKKRIKSGEIKPFFLGKKLTKKHRKAVSDGMRLAHKEGRAHNIGQSRWNNKPSYPEEFFMKVIKNHFENKNYKKEYPVSIYSIDFAWVKLKLAIEIDGDQHEKPEYKERDKRKNCFLEDKGWKILRIKWKDMFNKPQIEIQKAYNFIHQ